MKQKLIKSISYWMSVVVIGIVFGVSLQFVKAWTEPTDSAPKGNVGAPLNTGSDTQTKSGSLNIGEVSVGKLIPTSDNELASKKYVDSQTTGGAGGSYYTVTAANATSARCLPGDTMTGGGCWALDQEFAADSSSYGSMPVGNDSWACMQIGNNTTTTYVRCFGSAVGLYGRIHAPSDCTGANGTVIVDGEQSFCRFAANSCPVGWTGYKNYYTAIKNTCKVIASCTTGEHSWGIFKPDTLACHFGWPDKICNATITEIGCY